MLQEGEYMPDIEKLMEAATDETNSRFAFFTDVLVSADKLS